MAYTQIQKIENPTPSSSDQWGVRSVIDGYHMVVAREGTTVTEVYKRDINGVWRIQGNVTGETGLAMSGIYFTVTRPSSQALDIFDKDSFSSSLQTFTEATGTATFGNSAAINKNYIVVGDQAKTSNTGQIFIYKKIGVDLWEAYENNPVQADVTNEEDFFGSAVSIDGDSIIVGAKGDNQKTGAVYIFQKDVDTEQWKQTQKVFASDGEVNDQFGESISASDGYFVAGASLKDNIDGSATNSGAAYVFKYGTDWYEVDKLIGVNENNYISNHFGESVYINGDHIIIGSPNARSGRGVTDLFYKKRSWGHLKKIIGDDSVADDNFGTSVSISGRFIVVGAPGFESATTGGAVYLFEDPHVRLNLAQEFEVDAQFIPTKASVYLKRVGKNTSNFWPLRNTAPTVIDATNFSTITGEESIIKFEDSLNSFTGNGYMLATITDPSLTGDAKVINYPIKAINPDTYDLWIRVINLDQDSLEIDILLDGVVVKTLTEFIDNPSDELEWSWISTTLVVPDGREHILGIRIKDNNGAIDKIYIDVDSSTPYTEGPNLTASPYLTTHMRVFDIQTDLIGHWRLNDTGATSVVEEVTGNHNGQLLDTSGAATNVSNVTTTDAAIDRAFALDDNYFVKIPDANDFSFTDAFGDLPFSISFWAKFNDITSNDTVISKLGGGGQKEWQILQAASNIFYVLYDINGKTMLVFKALSGLAANGEWHFYVCSYEGDNRANGMNIFIDGVDVAPIQSDSGDYTKMSNTPSFLAFGSSSVPSDFLGGSLDNIMIFNKELSQTEINFLYNNGNGTEDVLPEFFTPEPNAALSIYDYKNSITEIIQDDWYNFDIKSLDTSYNSASDFSGNYYLVMTTSGSNTSNFVTWELVDNETQVDPSDTGEVHISSAIKF